MTDYVCIDNSFYSPSFGTDENQASEVLDGCFHEYTVTPGNIHANDTVDVHYVDGHSPEVTNVPIAMLTPCMYDLRLLLHTDVCG